MLIMTFCNKFDFYMIISWPQYQRGPFGRKWPTMGLLLSYCVIRSVIMHILFWVIMLLYAIFSSIVLCYNLFIIPRIRPKNSLSFSIRGCYVKPTRLIKYQLISTKKIQTHAHCFMRALCHLQTKTG